jgi:hypothetical protein
MIKMAKCYYVEKRYNTQSDVLLAYGVAQILSLVLGVRNLKITDHGPYFQLESLEEKKEEDFHNLPYARLLKSIQQRGSTKDDDVISLEEIRKKQKAFSEITKGKKRSEITDEEWALLFPDGDIYQLMRDLQGHLVNNRIVNYLKTKKKSFGGFIEVALAPFRQADNDFNFWENIEKDTGSSAMNPDMGKGTSRLKADGISRSNIDRPILEELLKITGMFVATFPRRLGKDYKVYSLCPKSVFFHNLAKIKRDFNKRQIYWHPIKLDVQAVLGTIITLLKYTGESTDLHGRGGPLRPADIIDGIYLSYYKDMGQAKAAAGLSYLRLPRWVEASTKEKAGEVKSLLEEHMEHIASLPEDNSGVPQVMTKYRDFLSSDDWSILFEYLADYGEILSQSLEDKGKRFIKAYSQKNLERMVQMAEPKYGEILADEGFRSIAAAIRSATITAQYLKAAGKDVKPYYGLGKTLKQKAPFANQFLVELAGFVETYNSDNARASEREGQQLRRNITTSDFQAVADLVDKYGSKLIGTMLVAFGYARDPKEKIVEEPTL